MPAFAAVVVASSGQNGNEFTISKPAADGVQAWLAGSSAALNGDMASATNDFPAWALYDDADGTPAIGEMWGAKAGSWKLRKGKAGFRICGTADTTQTLVQVERFVVAKTGTVGDCAKRWSRIPSCGTLTTREQEGACGCVPSQSVSLVKDASGNLVSAAGAYLYGCPPGVTTSYCPSGAPRKWNLTLAGFTGAACANVNGNWTLSYTSGNAWAYTRSGVTVTLTVTSSTTATLVITFGGFTISYSATISNCCSTITFSRDDDPICDDSPVSVTATPATACGSGPAYTPVLSRTVSDCGICLKLKWVPVAGSGARSIEFQVVECGTDSSGNSYIDFATDDPLLCTAAATECGVNSFVCRVACRTCEICSCTTPVSWTGAGWYCVSGNGCVYYGTDPGGGVTLCYGPQATQSDCENYVVFPCTCIGAPIKLPRKMCMSVALASGTDCLCLDGAKRRVTWASSAWENNADSPQCSETGTGGFSTVHYVNFDWSVRLVNPDAAGPCGTVEVSIYLKGSTGDTCHLHGYATDACTLAGGTPISVVVGGDAICALGTGPCAATGNPTYTITVTPDDTGCDDNPPAASYVCVDGSCVEVFDGSGSSYADCLVACSGGGGGPGCLGCSLLGLTPTLVIPDGPHAGTYSADGPWAAGAYAAQTTFTVGGNTYLLYCDGGGTAYFGFGAYFAGSTSCGPPTVMTFTGGSAGATGNVTVTT